MIIVVSDTSPIRALHHLALVPVLEKLFDHVMVPPAVRSELLNPPPRFVPVDISVFDFMEVLAPQEQSQI